jgi:hypothetical protein
MTRKLIALALITVAVAAIGILVWSFVFKGDYDVILGLTLFTIAATTFYGAMVLNQLSKSKRSLEETDLRTAIASSLVVSYLFILCISAFTKGPTEVGKLTDTFVTSFTGLVGTTIAFYFGAQAATQIFGKKDSGSDDTDKRSSK